MFVTLEGGSSACCLTVDAVSSAHSPTRKWSLVCGGGKRKEEVEKTPLPKSLKTAQGRRLGQRAWAWLTVGFA